MSLVLLHSPFSSSPIHVETRALCEAPLSLKKLVLTVVDSATHEALAEIFALQTLEELDLVLFPEAEVSNACTPDMLPVHVPNTPHSECCLSA